MAKDYYDILGVERSASQEDIKRAYRRMSKELHPDKHKGDKAAEQRYKEVNEAYEVLGNAKKRQMYDRFGSAEAGAQGFGGFEGFSAGDFGGFSDLFESFFGGGSRAGRGPADRRGQDIAVELTITLHEAYTGVARTLTLRRHRPCSACKGSGAENDSRLISCTECGGTGQVVRTVQSFFGVMQQSSICAACSGSGRVPERACSTCKGEGRTEERSDVTVEIPAGIQDGQALRIRGEGHAGRQGATSGDLLVHLRVEPDQRFAREGDDIHSSISIPVPDAILGTQIDVESVGGTVSLKVPAGTQPGQVLRVHGKGMPITGSSRHGDHYVTVQVDIPRTLTRRERALVEEWRNMVHG